MQDGGSGWRDSAKHTRGYPANGDYEGGGTAQEALDRLLEGHPALPALKAMLEKLQGLNQPPEAIKLSLNAFKPLQQLLLGDRWARTGRSTKLERCQHRPMVAS
jgi:hypothetical protein